MDGETVLLAAAVTALGALTVWAGAEAPRPGPVAAAATAGEPPRRIVSVTLATDEILLSLVPPERIAAVGVFADAPSVSNAVEEAKRIPRRVAGQVERILALEPDLVFVAQFTLPEVSLLLGAAGARVLRMEGYGTLDGIRRNVLWVGDAVGERAGAERLVREMDERLARVRRAVAGATRRPRALYLMPGGWLTEGSGTVVDSLLESAGGRNAAAEAGVSGQRSITVEAAVEIDPDLILVPGEQAGDPEDPGHPARAILDSPIWQGASAVRNGRVHVIPARYTTCVSHHVVKAAEAMARVLHPDRFGPEGGGE